MLHGLRGRTRRTRVAFCYPFPVGPASGRRMLYSSAFFVLSPGLIAPGPPEPGPVLTRRSARNSIAPALSLPLSGLALRGQTNDAVKRSVSGVLYIPIPEAHSSTD